MMKGKKLHRSIILISICFSAITTLWLVGVGTSILATEPVTAYSEQIVEQNQITGEVAGENGTPIEGALVWAQRRRSGEVVSALSNSFGHYTLTLDSGLWAVSTRHSTATVPNDWYWNEEPAVFYFPPDGSNDYLTQNLYFKFSQAVVRGFAKMPDGSSPPFDVIVSLKTKDGYGISRPGRDFDGFFWRIARSGPFTFQLLPQDLNYFAPQPQEFDLKPGDFIDVGEVKLISKTAEIKFGIVDSMHVPIGGIDVVAWSADGRVAKTVSSISGTVALPLIEGDWTVSLLPSATTPFIVDAPPIQVSVSPSQLIVISDPELQSAPNLITGTIVDEENNLLPVDGALAISRSTGEPIRTADFQHGEFEFYLPDGEFLIRPIVSPDSRFFATEAIRLSVAGQDQMLAVVLLPAEKQLRGALWDPREEEVVTGITGLLTAGGQASLNQSLIMSDTGSYQIDLAQGDWSLGFSLEPDHSHLPLNRGEAIEILDQGNQSLDLHVAKIDSAVTGRVFDPAGNPIEGAKVYARGRSALLKELLVSAQTDAEGRYYIELPHGRYTLWSDSAAQGDWVSPAEKIVSIGIKGIRPGIDFTYRAPDVILNGNLTLANGAILTQTAEIWATSGDGAYSQGEVGQNGTYTLPLLSGWTWEIRGAYSTENQAYNLEEMTLPTDSQSHNLTFSVVSDRPTPQAFIIESGHPSHIQVDKNFELFIPAGTLPVSGTAILIATPLAAESDRVFHRHLFAGYQIEAFDQYGNPITASYYQNLLVSLNYEPNLLESLRLNSSHLRPIFRDLKSANWNVPKHFAHNKIDGRLTFETNFLGSYSLLVGEQEPIFTYLPMLQGP